MKCSKPCKYMTLITMFILFSAIGAIVLGTSGCPIGDFCTTNGQFLVGFTLIILGIAPLGGLVYYCTHSDCCKNE